ncbi:MAG: hypothetical protein ACR2IH_14210, partial [Pyrinomonadaceae bacterium]
DIIVDGPRRSKPIYLLNNSFVGGVTVKDTTVVSSGNQFGANYPPNGQSIIPVIAKGASQIYSIGDKFCLENAGCETKNWELQDTAQLIYSTNQFKNTTSVRTEMTRDGYDDTPLLSLKPNNFSGISLLRMGRGNYWYDVTRSEADGTLSFKGNEPSYGYTFDANGGSFKVNNGNINFGASGTITLGTSSFANLPGSPNGTLYYCSDCQTVNPCASGGTGAIAKRLGGAWTCS